MLLTVFGVLKPTVAYDDPKEAHECKEVQWGDNTSITLQGRYLLESHAVEKALSVGTSLIALGHFYNEVIIKQTAL